MSVKQKIHINAYLDNNFGDDIMLKLLFDYHKNKDFTIYTDKTIIANTFSNYSNVKVLNSNQLNNNINNNDIYLSIGGSLYNDLNSNRGKIRRIQKIINLKKLKRRGIKIATIGCNLGPYKDKIGVYLTKLEVKLNDLFTVRDKESLHLLEKMHVKTKIKLADDIVYNLSLQKNIDQSQEVNDRGLGITTYRSLANEENNYGNYKALAAIADKYILKTGKPVYLLAYDSENENDLSAAHHIMNEMIYQDKVKIIAYLGNTNIFMENIKHCEKIIAIRFHGSIISDILKIPFYPIIYSNKTENLLRDRNYNGKYLNLDELSLDSLDIDKMIDDLLDNDKLFTEFKKDTNANLHFESINELFD